MRDARDRGLHTGTEYDNIGFSLGPPRKVWSFCPIRYCWVEEVASPIVAQRGKPVEDVNAEIAPEPLPRDGSRRQPFFSGAEARQNVLQVIEKMVSLLRERGELTANQLADLTGKDRTFIIRTLRRYRGEIFERVGEEKVNGKYRSVWRLARSS